MPLRSDSLLNAAFNTHQADVLMSEHGTPQVLDLSTESRTGPVPVQGNVRLEQSLSGALAVNAVRLQWHTGMHAGDTVRVHNATGFPVTVHPPGDQVFGALITNDLRTTYPLPAGTAALFTYEGNIRNSNASMENVWTIWAADSGLGPAPVTPPNVAYNLTPGVGDGFGARVRNVTAGETLNNATALVTSATDDLLNLTGNYFIVTANGPNTIKHVRLPKPASNLPIHVGTQIHILWSMTSNISDSYTLQVHLPTHSGGTSDEWGFFPTDATNEAYNTLNRGHMATCTYLGNIPANSSLTQTTRRNVWYWQETVNSDPS